MRTVILIIALLAMAPGKEVLADSSSSHPSQIKISKYKHHEYTASQGDTYILPDDSVLVAKTGSGKVEIQASWFMSHFNRDTLVEDMIWLMKSTGANDRSRIEATNELESNKDVENRDKFVVDVKENGGTLHRFTLKNTGWGQYYILTYERLVL